MESTCTNPTCAKCGRARIRMRNSKGMMKNNNKQILIMEKFMKITETVLAWLLVICVSTLVIVNVLRGFIQTIPGFAVAGIIVGLVVLMLCVTIHENQNENL